MLEALAISQAVLLAIVIGLAVAVFALVRQVGVLHERVAPMGALMTDRAISVGDAAPSFDLKDLNGNEVHIGGKRPRSQMMLFVSPNCPVCKKLLPLAKSVARGERGGLDLILVGDGDMAEQKAFVEKQNLGDVPYVVAAEVGMTYQVGKLPYAILLDDEGFIRAKGLVNSREHLESLLEAKESGYGSIQDYLDAHSTGRAPARPNGSAEGGHAGAGAQ